MNITPKRLCLSAQLSQAGLFEQSQNFVVSGGEQFRYSLKLQQTRILVAWFCWYEKPAVKRDFNPKKRFVGINEFITKHEISSEIKNLAKLWLGSLHQKHPTKTAVLRK